MQLEIFDYGMNGEGVAKQDGKIILVPHTLKGEIVDAEIIKDYENYAQAKLSSVLTPSSNRVLPACPYFYKCGGCNLLHMNYGEQLNYKTLLVKKTIKKICNIEFEVSPCVPCSNTFNYRNKISFSVKNNTIGFKKETTHNITAIKSCLIANNEINKILSIFTNWLNENSVEVVKNLVIRHLNNQTLIGVVTTSYIDLNGFISALKSELSSFGVYEIVNTRKDSVVLSGKVFHIFGLNSIQIVDYDLTYSVDLLGFHQTNTEIQNKIYDYVLNLICDNDVVVNGFSGQGLLSAAICKKARKVIGIEINASSHKSADQLKKANHITNLTNVCGDFFEEFKKYKKTASTVIVDPSKKGCGKLAMQEICGVKNIIYISCNPVALAKDINVIKDKYHIESITPFDMFPNTNSVETVIKLKIKEE